MLPVDRSAPINHRLLGLAVGAATGMRDAMDGRAALLGPTRPGSARFIPARPAWLDSARLGPFHPSTARLARPSLVRRAGSDGLGSSASAAGRASYDRIPPARRLMTSLGRLTFRGSHSPASALLCRFPSVTPVIAPTVALLLSQPLPLFLTTSAPLSRLSAVASVPLRCTPPRHSSSIPLRLSITHHMTLHGVARGRGDWLMSSPAVL